jgi:hypothetical protein
MSSSIAPQEPRVAAPAGQLQRMNIVIVGHVDHGKSTVIGRLLADTHSLPEGKLEQVRAQCELNSKPFEYAFLLDALKDEQAQGITIDAARVFFRCRPPSRRWPGKPAWCIWKTWRPPSVCSTSCAA